MSVDKPTGFVSAAETARALPRTLMGGTTAMRAAGVTYLPQEVAESDKAYQVRLNRSFLFNGYGKTVADMSGKVFSRPIILGDDFPPESAAWCENIDLAGRNLDMFAKTVFEDAFEGVSYILVDMAPATDGLVTKAQEKAQNRRPWFVHVKARQVLGWRSADINGVETLTQFRFCDDQCEPDGEFGEKTVKQIKVFQREGASVTWTTYRQTDKADWVQHESGPVSIGEIAVCPVYVNRTGFMVGLPPLAGLAEVNLAHWQSQSDQRNIMHVARVPILFGSGWSNDGAPIEIGSNRLLTQPDAAAQLRYVEHSGAAIGAGRDDLKDLEFQMQVLGLELLIPKPGGESATGAAIDNAKMNAPLAIMAMALQDALEQAFGFAGMYAGLNRDLGGGSLTVNTDFGVTLGAADVQAILASEAAGLISKPTAIRELQRRNVLASDIDPDEEAIAAMGDDGDDEFDDMEPYGPGASQFKIGDRVTVKPGKQHDAMTMGKAGTVVEVGTPAIGVKFDGMAEVHKWYTGEEIALEAPMDMP